MNSKKSLKTGIFILLFFVIGSITTGIHIKTKSVEMQTGNRKPAIENRSIIENENSSADNPKTPAVAYENTEIRRYTGENAHPYIHTVRTNNTDHKIIATKRGMMAFDKEGNPLMIQWNGMDSHAEPSYYYLYDWDTTEIAPQQTHDVYGGWSLNEEGTDSNVSEIEYVLYCDKKITFDDGVVWENPDFEKWRSAYEGNKVSVDTLKNYYPFEQFPAVPDPLQ